MVIVVHDVVNDEYVCQLPYFPPYESPSVRKHIQSLDVIIDTAALGLYSLQSP